MKPLSESLSPGVMNLIRDAMRAALEGPFFPDWEFATIMSVERQEMQAVLDAWPLQTVDDDTFICATVNALNNLIGYPHGMERTLLAYIPKGIPALMTALYRLDEAIEPRSDGKPIKDKNGYFDFMR